MVKAAPAKPKKNIYDADGDGIEDFKFPTYEEFDKYYMPAVFGVVEDHYNTLNGEMPGFVHKEFDDSLIEPVDKYDLTKTW